MSENSKSQISCVIPIKPLSLNGCFRGRRFMTAEYKAWREEVGYYLNGLGKLPKGAYELNLRFTQPHLWTWDVSNCIKTIEDSLVKSGIIHDDAYVQKITAEKFKGNHPKIEFSVKLYELPDI